MYIEELHSKSNMKNVTVVLSYDEIRDITNGLFYATQSSEENKNKYTDIYCKSKVIFDMVKHGNIQPETIEKLARLNKEGD